MAALSAAAAAAGLRSPTTAGPLRADTPSTLHDGERRWPVVDGVVWLRTGRDELREAAVAALDAGDAGGALVVLLADADDWWTEPPPPVEQLRAALGATTLREACDLLGLGRVGDYFTHRWAEATWLAVLGLLAAHWPGDGRPVVDVACGAGHVLRELGLRGVEQRTGVDVVLSKLWLARRFVDPGASYVCADATAHPVLAPPGPGSGRVVTCVDALYFLRDKEAAVAALRTLAGDDGALLVAHAHNALVEDVGAGLPLDPDGWRALLEPAAVYADEELADAALHLRLPRPAGAEAEAASEALALVGGPRPPADHRAAGVTHPALPPAGRPLRLSPLLRPAEDQGVEVVTARGDRAAPPAPGSYRLHAPQERWAAEYLPRLGHVPEQVDLDDVTTAAAAEGRHHDVVHDLVRRRVLIDLPESW